MRSVTEREVEVEVLRDLLQSFRDLRPFGGVELILALSRVELSRSEKTIQNLQIPLTSYVRRFGSRYRRENVRSLVLPLSSSLVPVRTNRGQRSRPTLSRDQLEDVLSHPGARLPPSTDRVRHTKSDVTHRPSPCTDRSRAT